MSEDEDEFVEITVEDLMRELGLLYDMTKDELDLMIKRRETGLKMEPEGVEVLQEIAKLRKKFAKAILKEIEAQYILEDANAPSEAQ